MNRVTEILSVISDPELDTFRFGVGERRFKEIMDQAAKRGTWFHSLCIGYASGTEDLASIALGTPEPLPSMLEGVKMFASWWHSEVRELVEAEKRYTDETLGITGQPDLIVVLKSGKLALVDIKYTAKLGKKTALQTAAYAHLCKGEHKIKERYALHVVPETAKLSFKQYKKASDWGNFLSAYNLFNWRNEV